MVGLSHPMVETESQSSSGGIFRYTLNVSELNERRAERKAKYYLVRLWGLHKSLGSVTVNSVRRTNKEPSGRVKDMLVKGPLSVYEVEATVDTRSRESYVDSVKGKADKWKESFTGGFQ